MLVSNNRPLTVAKPVANAKPVAQSQSPAKVAPTTLKITTKEPTAKPQGETANKGAIWGSIGGAVFGGVGMWATSAVIGALAGTGVTLAALPWIAGSALVFAGVGAIGGYVGGRTDEVVKGEIAKHAKNEKSQFAIGMGVWGLYESGSTLLKVVRGAPSSGLLAGIGGVLNIAMGGFLTVKELRGLKAERGGQTTDNKMRLGGAAMLTVGGVAAAASFIPAAAGAAAILLPVGAALALGGWALNLVGQFKNENKDVVSK